MEGGGEMATGFKTFTISVTPLLEEKLDKVKREHYYMKTKNDMIRELIALGLNALENDGDVKKCQGTNV